MKTELNSPCCQDYLLPRYKKIDLTYVIGIKIKGKIFQNYV